MNICVAKVNSGVSNKITKLSDEKFKKFTTDLNDKTTQEITVMCISERYKS